MESVRLSYPCGDLSDQQGVAGEVDDAGFDALAQQFSHGGGIGDWPAVDADFRLAAKHRFGECFDDCRPIVPPVEPQQHLAGQFAAEMHSGDGADWSLDAACRERGGFLARLHPAVKRQHAHAGPWAWHARNRRPIPTTGSGAVSAAAQSLATW